MADKKWTFGMIEGMQGKPGSRKLSGRFSNEPGIATSL